MIGARGRFLSSEGGTKVRQRNNQIPRQKSVITTTDEDSELNTFEADMGHACNLARQTDGQNEWSFVVHEYEGH